MNGKPLLLVLVVLALAAAAWFGLRGGGDPAPLPGVGPAAAAPKEGPGKAEAAQLANGGAAAKTDLAGPTERTAAPKEDGKAGKVAADVTIRGRLVDAAKAPRGGLVVELESWQNPDGLEFASPPDLPGVTRGKRPNTTSRADGTFEFRLAGERSGSLDLAGDEFVFGEEGRFFEGKKGDQDLGDLVVLPAGLLAGVVQDRTGKPIAGVKVTVGRGALFLGGDNRSTSDEQGRFRVGKLREGAWTLRTASGAFLPALLELQLAAGERRTDLVLTVEPGKAIAGQVLDDLGHPVAGCKVGCKRKEAHGGVDIERFTPDEAATTDQGGYFTLSGLTGDLATVRAFGAGHAAAIATDVPVGTGNLVLRVDRLASIEGVLVGNDGRPIAESRVRATKDAGQTGERIEFAVEELDGLPMGDGRATAVTGPDGAFRIENVRPGPVVVTAEGKTHRPVQQAGLSVQPAQKITGVRLVAELGATARVMVVDEAGKPVAGAAVRALRPPVAAPSEGSFRMRARGVRADAESGEVRAVGELETFGEAKSDAAGLAVLAGLPSGQAELRASHPSFAAALPASIALPAAGAVEARLTMRTPGAIDAHVHQRDGSPAAGCRVRLQGPGEDGEGDTTGTTDEKGYVHLGALPPGEYRASLARAVGGTRMGNAMFVMGNSEGGSIAGTEQKVTVLAGQTAVVDMQRPQLTKLTGTITGAGGAIGGCVVELERTDGPGGEQGPPGGLPGLPGMGGRTVTAGPDGVYAIDDIETGDYLLRFGKPEQIVKCKQPVHVAGDRSEQRQDLQMRTGKLRIQAWSKVTGEPIAGAEVSLHEAEEGAGQQRPQQRMMMVSISMRNDESGGEATTMTMGAERARTGADGWAEIDDVPAGSYDLHLEHDKHVPADKKAQLVTENGITDCGRVELGQAGRIRGKVVTADGKAVRMALVQRRPVGGAAAAEGQEQPQPAMGGNFKFDAVPPGRYLLKAQELVIGQGGAAPGAFGPEVEIEVKAGETAPAELHLPAK